MVKNIISTNLSHYKQRFFEEAITFCELTRKKSFVSHIDDKSFISHKSSKQGVRTKPSLVLHNKGFSSLKQSNYTFNELSFSGVRTPLPLKYFMASAVEPA